MWETSAWAQAWCPRCPVGRTLNYRGDMVAIRIHPQGTVHNGLEAIRARAREPPATRTRIPGRAGAPA
jgi:hypothetical protein